jgi:DNA-binding PadR family transcriptional regulator
MPTVEKYDQSNSLRDKILYVLSVMGKASPHEVATEIIELDEISTEEGVEDISVEIEDELNRLCEENIIMKLREHRQKRRYALNKNGKH